MNLKITPFKKKLPLVCVQGLGVVGSAMALAVASTRKQTTSIQCYWTREKNQIWKKYN